MDIPISNIDKQHVDDKTRTSISEDPEDGIVPIDISSRGEDVPPPPVQVLLELKEKGIKVIPPFDFIDVVPKKRTTRKRGIP
ncbi:hypothetical protein E5676_scaffold403G00310 [Cucumis melo var. makuwa]|uniref:Uncharacterized protein n=1 Tax=Cucumis melo var. makuwa TaxID=1194695 RepID=A0A5A7TSM6_CUCMM|nr:hypothetical protein E6C27_scaffold114G00630 [Cucumis melo var. makuwa]TYK28714.1 hypothetical protein E5676_scaffold403G00310 [Cucumis melo var. makuwa]